MKVILFGVRPPDDIRYSPVELEKWYARYSPLMDTAIAESGFSITRVVSGRASGFDTLGERWAEAHNVPIDTFPANWRRYGKQAGILRNVEMAIHGDAGIGFWNRLSIGTAHMIEILKEKEKPVHVHYIEEV